ncbi:family 78 glycoside hydrolase catalytic domain [Mucilaginibacter sp. HC2]|uniref:alpha-L-rhamnosidase n=1 Tax=Mucilaginibacter inviolabilis TaxID=2714892 RepID=UPI00140A66C6|nr:alpha-L-rhamnosidase [Mucilaginibacter inviolabilis]NHA04197.1 family 78 glycoside hydrolase catalytic domain [Mucilaginibacter inviolabilis]
MNYIAETGTLKKAGLSIVILLFICCRGFAQAQNAPVNFRVDNLICEYKINPIAVDAANPRMGWKLITQDRNIQQTYYEIRVGTNAVSLTKGKDLIWTSGKVPSDESAHVYYGGPMLTSREKCYWQVRVWNNKNQVTPWSMVNFWKMGLLKQEDWSAKWIQDNYLSDTTGGPSPMFRKTFKLDRKIRAAHLYITAHGVFEAQINGKRVGNDYFAPGWTSYNKRLQYQVYDVTSLLRRGENATGVTIGDGWYRGYTYNRKKNVYGKKLALLYQLEIVYSNGKRELITSDKSWKVAYGPIRSSSFFDGEVYDARKEKSGWTEPLYKDATWDTVKTDESIKSNLITTIGPTVKKHERFLPLKVFTTPAGERVIDFGQNLVGWVQFKLKAKTGDTVRLFHAEVLDQKGNFYTKNLRTAKQEITYVFKSDSVESYEPHFTFQGFRYLKVVGYNGPLDSTNVAAYALYSDMAQTGKFSTSNPLINQLQHNIQWGQKGNFIDVPTDCPQRDERMGWTGDAQAFIRTATFNMDVAGFFTKWLKDLSADQHKDGAVPYVIPNVLDSVSSAASGWSDVATIAPWTIYLAYGDKQVLQQQYESMKAWVGYIQLHSRNYLWDTGNHFGDWLFYAGTNYEDGAALTDKNLIAQAFYAYSTQLLINAARILQRGDDVQKYTQLLYNVKKAFQSEYVTPNGRMISGTQTSYVLALNFDLLPENLRESAAKRLVNNIQDYDEHITTGFLGTPYICHVLSRFGHTDIAYDLLMKESYPSWLYPVKHGATTIWERWDGIKPDGSFEDPGMNSFNHYAYGAIGDWMYRVIAGINTDENSPGFHKIIISPHPGGKLSSAQAELETLYGKVKSAWSIDNGIFTLDVIVPPNTTAEIVLPSVTEQITEGGLDINTIKEITGIQKIGNDEHLNAGSGTYHFVYTLKTFGKHIN